VQKPYEILRGVIPSDSLEKARKATLELKNWLIDNAMLGMASNLGTGTYWRGIETASRISPTLHALYSSDFMKSLVSEYMSEAYYYNDQVVVKMPKEPFAFAKHYDNQYAPEGLHQINFMWILDDITPESGGFKVEDVPVDLKAGDILVLDGNTVHASGINFTEKPRRAWACVYTTTPSNYKKFFSGRFI
jgi:hypothetical protein